MLFSAVCACLFQENPEFGKEPSTSTSGTTQSSSEAAEFSSDTSGTRGTSSGASESGEPTSSTSGVRECAGDRLDCNGDPNDGCEVSSHDDAEHCGTCDHSCLGGTCSTGVCQPFVVTDSQLSIDAIVADDDGVYWSAIAFEDAQDWVIRGHMWSSNSVEDLADLTASSSGDHRLARDGGSVYALHRNYDHMRVLRASKSGATQSQLLLDLMTLQQAGAPRGLALDASHIFLANNIELVRVSKLGDNRQSLAEGVGAIDVFRSPDRLAWALPDAGEIRWANVGADQLSELQSFDVGADGIVRLRGSGSSVYWSTSIGEIYSLELGSTESTLEVDTDCAIGDFQVDAQAAIVFSCPTERALFEVDAGRRARTIVSDRELDGLLALWTGGVAWVEVAESVSVHALARD